MNVTQIIKRDGSQVHFNREKIVTAIYKSAAAIGGHNRELSEKLADQVASFLDRSARPGSFPTVEEIQDLVEKVLIENGHAKTAKAYILYRDMRSRMRKPVRGGSILEPSEPIPYKLIWQVLSWNADRDVDTIPGLNRRVKDGAFSDLVADSEAAYHAQLDHAVETLMNRKERVKVVVIAGPSSSGKTTTTYKLTERLADKGLEPVPLNLDNYFFDLEMHPKDEYDDYDFETPEAIDLSLVNHHLRALLDGAEVGLPVFDFKSGKRLRKTKPLKLEKNQFLLVDTLHGLYEDLMWAVPDEVKFKIYIETFAQLKDADGRFVRWMDVRLIRRMIRDSEQRNYDLRKTIGHWHYVRRSEMKHIVPYIRSVDFIINGAIPYELPVYKPFIFDSLPEYIDFYRNDPDRSDALDRAVRIHKLLEGIEGISDTSVIPPDSLVREYIGGSIYDY